MARLTETEVNQIRSLAKNSFWFFVQSMMAPDWYDGEYHKPLCTFIQQAGHDKLVVLPRSHLKTTIAATYYPLWRAVKDSSIRVLIVSNSGPNAEKTVQAIRSMVESHPFIQFVFPEIIPKFNKVRWSNRCACLNRPEDYPEGTFESAGVGANIVRRHFNLIIQDDTVSPKKDAMTGDEAMPTRDDIEKAVGFHKLTIPLLITFQEDERIIIGTRWAGYDLINHIYENELRPKGRFEVYDKPAEDATGKPLYKRFSREALTAIKMGMGTYMYSSLYLNKPLAKEFMKFNPDWIQYYKDVSKLPDGHSVITVDPADPPTGKKDQSYSVALAAHHSKHGIHVLEYFRKRCSDRELINAAIDLAVKYGSVKVRLEIDRYAHMQYGFRDEFKRRGVHLICEGVKTKGKKKEARIMGLTPIAENGCLYVKRHMRELESEMFSFPRGLTVDILDALAWQLPDHHAPGYEPMRVETKTKRYNEFTFEQLMRSMVRSPSRDAHLSVRADRRVRDHLLN